MAQSEHSASETSRANSQVGSGVDRLPYPLPLTHVDETQPRNSANGLQTKPGDAALRQKCVQMPPTAELEAGQKPQHTRGQFATVFIGCIGVGAHVDGPENSVPFMKVARNGISNSVPCFCTVYRCPSHRLHILPPR
jgi:hypothetical protein